MTATRRPWRLIGVDVYSGFDYPLHGEYWDEESAIAAAQARVTALENNGQLGDDVYVVRPDGTEFRVQ